MIRNVFSISSETKRNETDNYAENMKLSLSICIYTTQIINEEVKFEETVPVRRAWWMIPEV